MRKIGMEKKESQTKNNQTPSEEKLTRQKERGKERGWKETNGKYEKEGWKLWHPSLLSAVESHFVSKLVLFFIGSDIISHLIT